MDMPSVFCMSKWAQKDPAARWYTVNYEGFHRNKTDILYSGLVQHIKSSTRLLSFLAQVEKSHLRGCVTYSIGERREVQFSNGN